MILYLKKLGVNTPVDNLSDIGNYRVRAEFIDVFGTKISADFSGYIENALFADLQYLSDDGFFYRYNNNLCYSRNYDYTIQGILNFINEISAIKYDEIVIKE